MKNGEKQKLCWTFVLHQAILEVMLIPGNKSDTTRFLSWEPHSASQDPVATASDCACEHLSFIQIYFMQPFNKFF